MSGKLSHEMTDAELLTAFDVWAKSADDATGWPSAYFAAKQLAAVIAIENQRGMALKNPFPIVVGEPS